jgi:hypothetical protein
MSLPLQNITNLCSAYSYCISVLDALYVWHGRGSLEVERKHAVDYANSMVTESMKVQELTQGEEDEMFWMVLGEEGYADADFWRFRPRFENRDPKWYRVSATDKTPVSLGVSH